MIDKINHKGLYIIEERDAVTNKLVKSHHLNNMLMAINQMVRSGMLKGDYAGTITDLEIKYFAFGTGTDPVLVTNTQLQTEAYRKAYTKKTLIDASTVQTVCSIDALEANFTIREIGIFCGPAAGAGADSGIMLSRVAVNITKNSNIVLNITRNDVCTI